MEASGQPRRVGLDDLTRDLRRVIRRGLPVDLRTAAVLLHLRSIGARAVHPTDQVSRLDALNALLTRFVSELEHDRYGQPARILFGLAPGTSGTTLTTRRLRAAEYLDRDPDHFRKRVEPEVLRAVAEVVYRDLLRYKKRTGAESVEPADNVTPSLRDEDFTAKEELASRIWQHVYGLRAELIAAGRLEGQEGYETAYELHRQAAEQQAERLRELIAEHCQTYGQMVRQGTVEYRARVLQQLVESNL